MNQTPGSGVTEDSQGSSARPYRHRLQLHDVDLLGADRDVRFRPGFNIIQGHITTGKTTMVRLIRALLGTVPSSLPPEVENISAIRAEVMLGTRTWGIYRPRTTTADAPVEVTELYPGSGHEAMSHRLRATGYQDSYGTFLLNALRLPVVSVPEARSKPTEKQVPVSMTDWLGYCIVTGDELDTQVFGHRHTFRDLKRRWIFELVYGYYDAEQADLTTKLRSLELKLGVFDRESAVREAFLAGTPFADTLALDRRLAEASTRLERIRTATAATTEQMVDLPGVGSLRQQLLAARTRHADVLDQSARVEGQLKDLADLHQQLSSQSARLTRAVVADEWLVDFDFVVCPRCGNDVEAGRAEPGHCYLCLQPARTAPSRDDLLAEQDRTVSQLHETEEVLANRQRDADRLRDQSAHLAAQIVELSVALDLHTETFVSDRAAALQEQAAQEAAAQAEITRLKEYLSLFARLDQLAADREDLERQLSQTRAQLASRELDQVDAEQNVKALEQRMLTYLRELHIPDLGQPLSVTINRTTYMPIVSGRTFDELSSQGLKTLVNIAHALAHHTIAIDRSLPLPGLLILDGISANTGSEGFDQARVTDVYRLLRQVGIDYSDRLQLIAVDNELPATMHIELADYVVLTLTQANRLIKIPPIGSS